jgi:putative ABC transport system permease protein
LQILVIAARNLARRSLRTAVALLGVAVGVSIVVSIFVSAGGLQRQFYRIATEFRGDLIATNKLAFLPFDSQISLEAAEQLATDPELSAVSLLRIMRQPISNSAGIKQPILVLGLRPSDLAMKRYPIVSGRALAEGDSNAIIVGALLAQDFGLKVGDELPNIVGKSRRIVGLFQSPLSGVPFLSGGIIIPLQEMSKSLNPDAPVFANIALAHVRDSPSLESSRAALADFELRLEKVHKALGAKHGNFKIQPIGEYLDSFQSQLEIIDKFAWAVSLLAVLAGGVGIMNTMLMSVFERTREIGLLKALGWPRWMIMATFITEGAILSFGGGLVGIPMGLAEVQLATSIIKLGVIEVVWDSRLFFQAVSLATVVGVLASLYPAWRAARLVPTEALRYE